MTLALTKTLLGSTWVPMANLVLMAETPAGIFWHFPQTVVNCWSQFYTPIDVPIYARLKIFLSNYLQLWPSYAILSATTQRAFQPMNIELSTKRNTKKTNELMTNEQDRNIDIARESYCTSLSIVANTEWYRFHNYKVGLYNGCRA